MTNCAITREDTANYPASTQIASAPLKPMVEVSPFKIKCLSSRESHLTFNWELCDFKEICKTPDYSKHIRSHLKKIMKL